MTKTLKAELRKTAYETGTTKEISNIIEQCRSAARLGNYSILLNMKLSEHTEQYFNGQGFEVRNKSHSSDGIKDLADNRSRQAKISWER